MVPDRLSPGLFRVPTPTSSIYDEPGPQCHQCYLSILILYLYISLIICCHEITKFIFMSLILFSIFLPPSSSNNVLIEPYYNHASIMFILLYSVAVFHFRVQNEERRQFKLGSLGFLFDLKKQSS